jgi:hypothetical protein
VTVSRRSASASRFIRSSTENPSWSKQPQGIECAQQQHKNTQSNENNDKKRYYRENASLNRVVSPRNQKVSGIAGKIEVEDQANRRNDHQQCIDKNFHHDCFCLLAR